MEFLINEQGCRNLSNEMFNGMNKLGALIAELECMDGTLRSALGEDYEAIGHSISIMKSEFLDAQHEFRTILNDMNEYIAKVQQVRVVMNNGN